MYAPEWYHYASWSAKALPFLYVENVYKSMQVYPYGLFSSKWFGDLWFNADFCPGNWEANFVSANTQGYVRYVALNFGLGGLFTKRTPRDFIEGYTDPHLSWMQNTPVYLGGDKTVNSWIQVDPPTSTTPSNNQFTFFTGEGNPDMTRTYAIWNGQSHITVQSSEYTSTIATQPVNMNPWNFNIPVIGTDGIQFSANMTEGMGLKWFVNSLSRPMALVYMGENDDIYEKLNIYKFMIEPTQMLNSTSM